jgi:reductive dehalogenase
LITGLILCFFLGIFAVDSVREQKPRSAILSLTCLTLFSSAWLALYIILDSGMFLLIPSACVALFAFLFFAPVGRTTTLAMTPSSERVDERDTMFAREEYAEGTPEYIQYYSSHPELKNVDDRIRNLPELLEPGGKFYEHELAGRIDSVFDEIRRMVGDVDGEVSESKHKISPESISLDMKKRTLELGADEVGIARLNQAYVYSHTGRGPDKWGAPITVNHDYAIAFTLEMDYRRVEQAPRLPITEETAVRYREAARISILLAKYIMGLGFSARAHISGSNYQVILPPIAYDAGLGELGRNGYLISKKFGARIRLGVVTTNLPLVPDKPVSFGVRQFCDKCFKCAVNCPSSSIPYGKASIVRGVEKWPLEIESCLRFWRVIGTDCGLCMKVCPFSHPRSIIHDLIRMGIARSSFARTISVWGDDLFYGRKFDY